MILILAIALIGVHVYAVILGELDNLGLTRHSRPYNPAGIGTRCDS